MNFDKANDPHIRIDILTGSRVLVSPHRSRRPWQGQVEKTVSEVRSPYDSECYLCPGNKRAGGAVNPQYKESFVFVNDFSALLDKDNTFEKNESDLFIIKAERGICKVIIFNPRHDLTLAEMEIESLIEVVKRWKEEFVELSTHTWVKYIQIFENKGSIMGCSNPHPHGQIWAQQSIPSSIVMEGKRQMDYFQKRGNTLLKDYMDAELRKNERVIVDSEHFICIVPYWAKWPFETILSSKRMVGTIADFSEEELKDLAVIIQELTIRYDNLFQVSFPYSAGMHQAPVNSGEQIGWHWHMHFYPPLLRSSTIKKFMVGYEMLADAQRDITPEQAAEMLKRVSTIHYKKHTNG